MIAQCERHASHLTFNYPHMKRPLICFLLVAVCWISKAQTDNRIAIGRVDTIQSAILKEKRKIWVHIPESATDKMRRYPVVYLLDGDAHFYSVVGMMHQLSSVNLNMICPEMIVVGIPNTDRTRDLTPTHVKADPPYVDSAYAKTSGGGEKFIAFMEKELMPYINQHYPTAPYKVLIGHSFGGLAVMQTFVHHTSLFNTYICIDPSMWWDKQTLLKQAQQKLANTNYKGTTFFLGIANTMEDGMTLKKVVNDTTSNSRHIRAILALRKAFEHNSKNGLKYQGKFYEKDSHGSVPLITEYDALHFIFNFYSPELTLKDYFSDADEFLADKVEKHFTDVSAQMGYKVKPPEMLMNRIGFVALMNKHHKKAERFFKYNVNNYPENFSVYDALGDYYAAVGDKAAAVVNFKKALTIKENANTSKKIERLTGK